MIENKMQPLRAMVVGATGRMGRELIKAIIKDQDFLLSAAIDLPDSDYLGQDAGLVVGATTAGCLISDDPLKGTIISDVIFDFTTPEASCFFCELAAQARIVHVVGTTGFSAKQEQKLSAGARHAQIIKSSNMSLGVNLLAELLWRAAKVLDDDFDIEISDFHHRAKRDAPSGTALLLAKAAARGRGIGLNECNTIKSRVGDTGTRVRGAIGFQSLRGGNVVGEHMVTMAGDSERVVLGHHADDRSVFARGALKAGLWGHGRKAGLYSMRDVLGLDQS